MKHGHVTGHKRERKGSQDWYRQIEEEHIRRVEAEALVGFQGRGYPDDAQPDFCHPLLLEALLFQWPSK